MKAVGVGHSWHTGVFCAGNDSDSIGIVMTELKPVLDFIVNPVNPKEFVDKPIPSDFPIKVNEEEQTVTVAAGISQRHLLEYLSEVRTNMLFVFR